MRTKKINTATIYLLTFLFTLHITPVVYVTAGYLNQFISEKMIGYVYSGASLITAFLFIGIRHILQRFGNYRVIIFLIILEMFSLGALAIAQTAWLALFAFIISFSITALVYLNIDIFIESISKDSQTGGIRGTLLTSLNTAFILGPLITGLIITDTAFWKIYVLGIIVLIPTIFIVWKYLYTFKDPVYKKIEFNKTALQIWKNKNLNAIFSSIFLLQFFYAIMVIYTPIYLHNSIGFTYGEISLIIGIALIPFVLLEIPLGKIADSYLGEKEILVFGFIITGIATSFITFYTGNNIVAWMTILFITRIGASMLEVMNDAYLFKKISAKNINIMGFYRMIRPFGYIVAPLLASGLLLLIDIKFIFLILGIIMLFGTVYGLKIEDTK